MVDLLWMSGLRAWRVARAMRWCTGIVQRGVIHYVFVGRNTLLKTPRVWHHHYEDSRLKLIVITHIIRAKFKWFGENCAGLTYNIQFGCSYRIILSVYNCDNGWYSTFCRAIPNNNVQTIGGGGPLVLVPCNLRCWLELTLLFATDVTEIEWKDS